MNRNNKQQPYINPNGVYLFVLRIGAAVGAITLWVISLQFSVAGFDITMPGYTWVGWALAFVVTVLQLIFNRGISNNPTLFLAGLLAYAYGVTTNIVGIIRVQESIDTVVANVISDPIKYVPGIVFAVVLALVIEIVPEALLLWAWFADNQQLGDFVSSLMNGTSVAHRNNRGYRYYPQQQPQNNNQQQNQQNKNKQQHYQQPQHHNNQRNRR